MQQAARSQPVGTWPGFMSELIQQHPPTEQSRVSKAEQDSVVPLELGSPRVLETAPPQSRGLEDRLSSDQPR